VSLGGGDPGSAPDTETSHELSVALNGTGAGTVTSNRVGIDCSADAGADCSNVFRESNEIVLMPMPADGSET
jgi:hypothetical protein